MNFIYINQLIKNCELAKTSKIIREFDYSSLSELEDITQAIYIIEEVNGDKEKTFSDLKKYKALNQRRCPRLNKASPILYIGSSTTGLKKRINEHLGNGSKSTYSLQLKHWFKGKYRIKIKIYDEPIEILQIIEDNLSYQLKPAFGKQGGNNK